jgi:transposase
MGSLRFGREEEKSMKSYSDDLRSRIINSYSSHEGSQRQLAARYCVSLSFVRDLLKRLRETGKLEPKPHGGGWRCKVDEEGLEVIRRLLNEAPDATLEKMCEMFAERRHVHVSRSTMSRAIQKLKLKTHSS